MIVFCNCLNCRLVKIIYTVTVIVGGENFKCDG